MKVELTRKEILSLEGVMSEFKTFSPSSVGRDLCTCIDKTYKVVVEKIREYRNNPGIINIHKEWLEFSKKDYEDAKNLIGVEEKKMCDDMRYSIGLQLCRKDANGNPYLKSGEFVFDAEGKKAYTNSINDFHNTDQALAYDTLLSEFEKSDVATEYHKALSEYNIENERIQKEFNIENGTFIMEKDNYESISMPSSFILPSNVTLSQKDILVRMGVIYA